MATLAERLQGAEDALHKLQTGAALVTVRNQAGEYVQYRPADLPRLSAYVAALRRETAGRSAKRAFNPTVSKGL